MAKVTITITDGNDGVFGIVSNPSAGEMAHLLAAGEAMASHKSAMITMKLLQKILSEAKRKKIISGYKGKGK